MSVNEIPVLDMQDLHLPIAIRRCRRSTPSITVKSESTNDGTVSSTAPLRPKTPAKKKARTVRFSDPGPSSSGLTPLMRRAEFATPRHRRRSGTPLRNSSGGSTTPVPPPAPFVSARKSRARTDATTTLHRTLDGRVERQSRRHGYRSLFHRNEARSTRILNGTRAEIERLKRELEAKDAEIEKLQSAASDVSAHKERISDLQGHIHQLEQLLQAHVNNEDAPTEVNEERTHDWLLAEEDPFVNNDYHGMDLDGYHSGDEEPSAMQISTPSRARESFPTPPATSPVLPGTPCSRLLRGCPTSSSNLAVQVSLPDPDTESLEEEIESLQQEVSDLTTLLESYKAFQKRLTDRIAASKAESSSMDIDNPSLDHVEKQVLRMLESMAERTTALEQLSSSIKELGFPGKNAQQMLISLASGFRAARLEIEYLTPGEIPLPLSSHGAEVLDLLLTKLRGLARQAQEDESAIDEYHDLEQLLRKQLDGRVSAMDQLRAETERAQDVYRAAERRIHELDVANRRLRGAVDTYTRDIRELEQLVQRTDKARADAVQEYEEERQRDREAAEERESTIAELQEKLKESVQQAERLLQDMSDEQDKHVRRIVALNRAHGAGLALRDARVMDLRVQVERAGESLRDADETICRLRVENGDLRSQMRAQQDKAEAALKMMKEELQRVLSMCQELQQQQQEKPTPKRKRVASEETASDTDEDKDKDGGGGGDSDERPGEAPPARLLSGELARRASGSKKKRRRPDSGLGLLDEEECEMF